jgi:hypothetical protein
MEGSSFHDERVYDLYLILASMMALGIDDETRKKATGKDKVHKNYNFFL